MAIQIQQRFTLQDFEALVAQPENSDKTFEFIGGEIVEVPSNPLVSKIAMLIGAAILFYLREHDIGHVTGEAGGYMIGGDRYAPDVAFISYERQPELAGKGYNPNPPELAVEVISNPDNADEQRRLRFKVTSYLAAGVTVWIVNVQAREVEVYQAGQVARILGENDTLTADHILPEFKLAVSDIFPKQPADS